MFCIFVFAYSRGTDKFSLLIPAFDCLSWFRAMLRDVKEKASQYFEVCVFEVRVFEVCVYKTPVQSCHLNHMAEILNLILVTAAMEQPVQ